MGGNSAAKVHVQKEKHIMINQIRQGEILLVRVSEETVPSNYVTTEEKGRVLLGIGETGNAHTLVAKQVAWLHDAIEEINDINAQGAAVAKRPIYVRVDDGHIDHSDRVGGHDPLPVDSGVWQVVVKREQMPGEAAARFVAD